MSDLPGPIRDFIEALTDDLLSPAFMLVSDEGRLSYWGGTLSSYGISRLKEDMQIDNHVPFLMGTLPLDSGNVFLPKVQTAKDVFADVYLFRRKEGTWILLLDATDDVKKRQALQQRTYDISLRAAELEHEGRTLFDANSRLSESVKEQTLELSQTVVRLQQELAEGRQREQALSESEARFRSLFDSNVMGIAYFDSQGNVFESNNTFLELLGYSRDDLKRGLLTWSQLAPIASDFSSSSPQETLMQQEFIRKDQSRIWLLFASAPQLEVPGNRIGFAISSQPKSTQASS
jgi:PAS domain S-box-containing protein